jgi:hypothetical protein
VEEIEADSSLSQPDRFRERIEALDRLDAYDLDSPFVDRDSASTEAALYRRAIRLRARLEDSNAQFYEGIRDAIRGGAGRDALLQCAPEAAREEPRPGDASAFGDGDSYDYLDELISGVLRFAATDEPKVDLPAEMVAYQPTPARHLVDLIRRSCLNAQDVFIDLGSGLGHVALLVAACTNAQTVGIEIEPAYVEAARRCAAELHLTQATFLAQDVREADLSSGTVFYLYTPFRGAILRAVLHRLRAKANERAIRVCTFGPCTPIVAAESWLALDAAQSGHVSVFRSRR